MIRFFLLALTGALFLGALSVQAAPAVPSLNVPATVQEDTAFPVTGQDFPRGSAVFVVFEGPDGRSFLTQADRQGSIQVSVVLGEVGSYDALACFLKGGRWDCQSTPHVALTVTP